MRQRSFVVWTALALGLAVVWAGARPAEAGLVPYVMARASMPAAGEEEEELTHAEAHAACPFGFDLGSEAHALGDITQPGAAVMKALSKLTIHDPVFGNRLEGGADVETYRAFKVTSDTLPAGTEATVDLAIRYEGLLQAQEGAQGLWSGSEAEFLLELSCDGKGLAQHSGYAAVFATSEGSDSEAGDDWAGCLVALGGGAYELTYDDSIQFTGVVGQVYGLYADLATAVVTSQGAGCENYGDTLALADFWNTGTYALSSPDPDVGFATMPEPASVSLLGAGVLMVLRRRRRRAA